MSFSSLPIIDLQAEDSTIISAMFNACSTTGFFYLRHHQLTDLQCRMFQLAKEFFHLPLDIKERCIIDENNHGYVRRGQENLDSSNTKLIDEKEAFNIGKTIKPKHLPDLFKQSENLQLITEFHRGCYDLSMRLLTYLARSFSVDVDYFTSRHEWKLESGDTVRLLHYPSVSEQSDEGIRAGAHSDYGSMTLLFQYEHKSGLEVLDRSTNIWYPVEPFDDMIVVNFGDAFEYWSKGFIKSTVHRVVMPLIDAAKDNERYSIAFFCHPNHSTLLTPIPSEIIHNHTFEKDEHAKHALDHENEDTLTAGQHLKMRLDKTYTY
jgi:isopenicillin N synthase-like dioxygenase